MGKLSFKDSPPVCHNCDYLGANKAEPTLVWPAELWAEWKAATNVRPELEILALFTVETTGDERRVAQLEFPRQRVSGGECELLEQNGHADGMIHSHHNMSAFFSGADKDTALPNYTFNIVTSHKGEYKAVERVQLPCGGYGFRDLTVQVEETATDTQLREYILQQCEVEAPKVITATPAPSNGNGKATVLTPYSYNPYDSYPFGDSIYPTAGDRDDERNPRMYAGCHSCEMFWPTLSPPQCWFCQKPIGVVSEFTALRFWEDAEDVTMVSELDRA